MKHFLRISLVFVGVLAVAGVIAGFWYAGMAAEFGRQYVDLSDLWMLNDIPSNIDGNLHLDKTFDSSKLLSFQYPGSWIIENTDQGVRLSIPGTDAFVNIGMFEKGRNYTTANIICEDAQSQAAGLGAAVSEIKQIKLKSHSGVEIVGCLLESLYPSQNMTRRNLLFAVPDNIDPRYILSVQFDGIEGDFAEHQLTFQRMVNTIKLKNIMQPNFKLNFDLRRNKTE